MTECDKCRPKIIAKKIIYKIPSNDICIAPFRYDGRVRNAILEFKFNGVRFNAKSLSERMTEILREYVGSFDIVTCVPVSKQRMRERGFNQSKDLAKGIALLLGKSCCDTLKKTKNNKVQHMLDKSQRQENVIGVYSAINTDKFIGKRILLVDDICTTGNTLAECCRVLYAAGAAFVLCAAIAVSYE